jgi:hypothetical protein
MEREPTGTRNKGQRTGNEPAPRRKGDDIAERLLDAVEGVRQLLAGLHDDAAAKHVAKQLWRAVTSGGANYEEARGAESRADFVHKVLNHGKVFGAVVLARIFHELVPATR